MLDFRRKSQSTHYLHSSQQRKLLATAVAVGVVLILISIASNPRRWEWMLDQNAMHVAPTKQTHSTDTRLTERNPKERGTFHAPPSGLPDEADRPSAFFPGVRRDVLDTIRDDTVFRKAEQEAWFDLFNLLAKANEQDLANSSTGKVGFRQLFSQPRAYRGRVITLTGVIRGAMEKKAPANHVGIDKYYQLSIEPTGERGQLVVAYVLELPKNFPAGDRIYELATIHGIFFKRWAYRASDAVRTAPLILARSVEWQLHSTQDSRPAESPLMAVAIAVGFFLLVSAFFAVLWPRRRTIVDGGTDTSRFSPEALAALVPRNDADSSSSEAGKHV